MNYNFLQHMYTSEIDESSFELTNSLKDITYTFVTFANTSCSKL